MEASNSLAGRVLAVLLALLPTLAVLAPVQIPYFLALGGIAGYVTRLRRQSVLGSVLGWPEEWDRPLVMLLVALIAYCGLSALWSLDSGATVKLTFRIALLVVALLGFVILCSHAERARSVRRGAQIGLIIGGAILCIEIATGGIIRETAESALALDRFQPRTVLEQRLEYSRTAPVAVLVCWSLSLWAGIGGALITGRQKIAWILTVGGGLALAIAFIPNGAAKVAFLAAIGGILLALILGARKAILSISALAIVIALAAPLAAVWLGSPQMMRHVIHKESPLAPRGGHSLMHRLKIWEFTADRALQKPIVGWGLDAARRLPGGDDRVTVEELGVPESEIYPDIVNRMRAKHNKELRLYRLRLHPHNAALQIWLELGFIGILLVSGILARAAWLASGSRCFVAVPVISAGVVLASLSFGVWQGWWIATLLTAGGLCFVFARGETRP